MKTYTIEEIRQMWLHYKTPVFLIEPQSGLKPDDLINSKPGLCLFIRNIDGVKEIDRFSEMSFPEFVEFYEKNIRKEEE